MRRIHLIWIASWMAIGLSACTTLRPPEHLDTAKACADWRWIGISQSGARCPKIQGWTVRPLFPQLAPVRPASGEYCKVGVNEKIPSLSLIDELSRFCVYEIADRKKGMKDLSFPSAASAGLARLDKDCAALALGERYLDAKSWKPKAQDLLGQASMLKTPFKIEKQKGVQLTFLDTQPDGESVPEEGSANSPHGYTLAQIAEKLVCPLESGKLCAAKITTRLALPIFEFDAKNPKRYKTSTQWGGFLGLQSHLADAIQQEVANWHAEGKQQHLILNLSLAWDGKLFDGLDKKHIREMSAGTQAVYQALQYAADFDVLVLAAAGNQKREPCVNYGPLLPAAWEQEAPRDSCGGKDEEPPPLLYAVGGVQSNGWPLANARDGGMPRRAAYGETAVFTGSSVATAVVSSIAAVVWNALPEKSAREIMDILDQSGHELSFKADFWSGTNARPNVHRLSLCKALQKACELNPGRPSVCQATQCHEWSTQELNPLLAGSSNIAPQGSCQPWVYPQPEDNPCMACISPPYRDN